MKSQALDILAKELQPAEDPVLSSVTYRRQLALGLFYKVNLKPDITFKYTLILSSSSTSLATLHLQQ